MRYCPLTANVLTRQVVAKDGVILPDGSHLPEETTLDEQFYPNPGVFDPFRYLVEKKGAHETELELAPGREFTTPDEAFLLFGYGRNAW
jgi:hypothetical protein